MSIKHLYEDERPALLLDFANSKTLDPRITFTRNSTATYVDELGVIKTAAAGEGRIDHDPATGECLGLLIEESRTNLTLHSEDFTNAAWSHGAETLHSANQAVAPDGTTTADLIYPNSTGFARTLFQNYGNASGTYTVSVFAKAAGRNFIYVYNAQGNAKAWFNLSTGTKGSADANIDDYDIIDYGNDWYRCYVRTNSTTARYFYLGPADADNSTEVTASGTNGIYVWGAQFEEGSFPTSYIPTSGSTYQRLADEASITGTAFSNWYNQSEGTWFAEAKCPVSPNNQWIWALNPSGTGEDMLYRGSTDALRSLARYRGDVFDTNDAPSGQFNKAVLGYNLTSQASSYFNAVSGIYSSISGNTGTPTSLAFGLTPGNSVLNGHISRLAYYNTRLSDTALEALTL